MVARVPRLLDARSASCRPRPSPRKPSARRAVSFRTRRARAAANRDTSRAACRSTRASTAGPPGARRRRVARRARPRSPGSRDRRQRRWRTPRTGPDLVERRRGVGGLRDRGRHVGPAASGRAPAARRRPSPPAAARRRPRVRARAGRCRRCRRGARPGARPEQLERPPASSSAVELRAGRARRPKPHSMTTIRSGRSAAAAAQSVRAEWRPAAAPTSMPAGGRHQVGHPVAGQVERLEPFDAEHPRRGTARRRRAGAAPAGSGAGGELVALGGEIERPRHRADVRQHARPRCGPSARAPAAAGSRPAASRWTSPSATAQTSQRSWVMIRSGASRRSASASTAMTGSARLAQPPDLGVDAAPGQRRVERRRGDPGQMLHRGGIVALVGDADQRSGRRPAPRRSRWRPGAGSPPASALGQPAGMVVGEQQQADEGGEQVAEVAGQQCRRPGPSSGRAPRPGPRSPSPGRDWRCHQSSCDVRRPGAGSRPAVNAAAPNSVALTSASAM